MSSKVVEADAGIHSLAMAVAVSKPFEWVVLSKSSTLGPRADSDSLLCVGPFAACNELATIRYAHLDTTVRSLR